MKEGEILSILIQRKKDEFGGITAIADGLGTTIKTLTKWRDLDTLNKDNLNKILSFFNISEVEFYNIGRSTQHVSNISYNVTTLNIEAVAGNAIITQVTVLENGKMFIPSLQKGRAYFSIGVRGDSMLPKFKSGDMLVVYKIESINDFEHDKYYVVFTLNNGTLLKRVRRVLHGEFKGYIELISENTRYQPYYVEEVEILQMYRVVCSIIEE